MDHRQWLEGVQRWYNYQDYLGAIETWEECLKRIDWNDETQQDDTFPTDILEEPSPLFDDHENANAARLLLFLAGCQLDAQNVHLARILLIRCLRCCRSGSAKCTARSNNTARLAIQEWLCSYEEEAQVQDDGEAALLMSRKIVEYAIRKGCDDYWHNCYQRPGFLYPLSNESRPHYEGDFRPSWCSVLENNWERIRDEFQQLARGGSTTAHWPAVGSSNHRDGAGQHDHKVVDGDWREIVLFGSGARPELAPFTSGLIRKYVHDAISLAEQGGGEVIFSVLSPGTRIRPHCGSTNLRLTAHLGLSIPSTSIDDCAIRIGDTWYPWKEGNVLIFDDSYEHEVKNTTAMHRAVLLLRFWHPGLDTDRRAHSLSKAMKAKEFDALRRYNPPLPDLFAEVEQRGLKRTKCSICWRSGYDTIKLLQLDDPVFVCTCNHPIIL